MQIHIYEISDKFLTFTMVYIFFSGGRCKQTMATARNITNIHVYIPLSQLVPVNDDEHWQVYPPPLLLEHVPPFWHGLLVQGKTFVVKKKQNEGKFNNLNIKQIMYDKTKCVNVTM